MTEITGGSSPNQYRKSMLVPLTEDRSQFVEVDIETGDITDAWNMNGNIFNVQKAIHRFGTKSAVSDEYDLDKILWFTLREKLRQQLISPETFWEQAASLGLAD